MHIKITAATPDNVRDVLLHLLNELHYEIHDVDLMLNVTKNGDPMVVVNKQHQEQPIVFDFSTPCDIDVILSSHLFESQKKQAQILRKMAKEREAERLRKTKAGNTGYLFVGENDYGSRIFFSTSKRFDNVIKNRQNEGYQIRTIVKMDHVRQIARDLTNQLKTDGLVLSDDGVYLDISNSFIRKIETLGEPVDTQQVLRRSR